VFLPTHPEVEPLEGSQEEDRLAALPRLLLRRFEARERLPILKCTGVVSIVSFDGEIAPIPITRSTASAGSCRAISSTIPARSSAKGPMVEVVHGPLKGVVGRLVRKGAHARLVLAVDLIGQAVSVEVDAADVRPYWVQGSGFRLQDSGFRMKIGEMRSPRRSRWRRWPG
jgi:hypothetical protein